MNAATAAKHFEIDPTAPRTCGDETCMACCAGTCERAAAPPPFDVEARNELMRFRRILCRCELMGSAWRHVSRAPMAGDLVQLHPAPLPSRRWIRRLAMTCGGEVGGLTVEFTTRAPEPPRASA